MSSLTDLISKGQKLAQHRPWPRVLVDAPAWSLAADELAQGRLSLLALWGEPACVHMAVSDATAEVAVLSLDCPDRTYPSIGKRHPPAIRPERTINDLFGLIAEGS